MNYDFYIKPLYAVTDTYRNLFRYSENFYDAIWKNKYNIFMSYILNKAKKYSNIFDKSLYVQHVSYT